MGRFQMDVDRLEWINGVADDPEDLCLHGHVVVRVGDVVLEDHATVSATGLYLLKSLTEDHLLGESIQMLPCCGFCMCAAPDLMSVEIIGCNSGIDWSVIHDGDQVRIVLESGQEERVPLAEYCQEVFRFADRIEAFYQSCTPKKLPKDPFDRDGYAAFWNEWRRRRQST